MDNKLHTHTHKRERARTVTIASMVCSNVNYRNCNDLNLKWNRKHMDQSIIVIDGKAWKRRIESDCTKSIRTTTFLLCAAACAQSQLLYSYFNIVEEIEIANCNSLMFAHNKRQWWARALTFRALCDRVGDCCCRCCFLSKQIDSDKSLKANGTLWRSEVGLSFLFLFGMHFLFLSPLPYYWVRAIAGVVHRTSADNWHCYSLNTHILTAFIFNHIKWIDARDMIKWCFFFFKFNELI